MYWGVVPLPLYLLLTELNEAHQVLGVGDQVERRGQRAPVLKEVTPQLGTGELPLHVSVILQVVKGVNVIMTDLESAHRTDTLVANYVS